MQIWKEQILQLLSNVLEYDNNNSCVNCGSDTCQNLQGPWNICLFSRILVGRKSVNSAGYCICHSPALQPFVQFPAAHLCTPESFDLNLLQLKIPLPDPTEFTCSLYYSRDLDYSPENFSFLSNKFKFVNTLAWYQPHLWDCSSPSLVIPLLAWLALIRFQKRMNIQYVSLLAY